MAILPGFSAQYVSRRIRLLIAIFVAFAATPMVIEHLPPIPGSAVALFVLLVGEAMVGVFFGALGRIVFGALHTAGVVISFVSSMANAFIQDPISEQQGSIIAGFLTTCGMLVVFVTNMHHMMLSAVVESYTLFVPGEMPIMGDFADVTARNVMDAFTLGVQIASPLMVAGLTHFLMMGVLTKLMPNLPVFFFGLPIQITVQIFLLGFTLSAMMLAFGSHFETVFTSYLMP